MPNTRKKAETSNPQEKQGVTLSVTITDEQYLQILHTAEVRGYVDIDEWLQDIVIDNI